MLIIEGADLVGKTTVAQKFLKLLPTHIYAHFGKLPPQFDYLGHYIARASMHIVQDRFHMSEIVYTNVMKREVKLFTEFYRLVDAYLRTQGSFTIIITVEDCLIEKRWRDGEDFEMEKVLKCNERFKEIARLDGKWHDYDVDFDLHWHFDEDKPYATDDMIKEALECYLTRLSVVDVLPS